MSIKKISHIGIAVADLERQRRFYQDVLGLEVVGEEEVPEQKVRVVMFQVGESRIELLEPTSEVSPIAKFIAKRGPGIHHIAYDVDGIDGAVHAMKKAGVRMIDEIPRSGADNHRIAFLHPKATFGVLTEFCEASTTDS